MIRTYIFNFIVTILPATRAFWFKRKLATLLGYKVGENSKITGGVRIFGRGKIIIGDNTWIGLGCQFITSPVADIVIGNNCDIAPFCKFVTGSHEIGSKDRRAGNGFSSAIKINEGSWVGANCLLLGGVSVGKGTLIGAGSVLLPGTYSDCILLCGNPAVEKKIYEY